MTDENFSVTDEFAATTLEGVPYGVTNLGDFYDDLAIRIVLWVHAQVGVEGLSDEDGERQCHVAATGFSMVMQEPDILDIVREMTVGELMEFILIVGGGE